MPSTETLSITLPTEMAILVRLTVETGEYSSQSDVIRDALIEWSHKRNLRAHGLALLRKAWMDAVVDDGEKEDPGPVLKALEKKYKALADASGD